VAELARPTLGPALARDCELLFHRPGGETDYPTGLFVDPRVRLKGRVIRLRVSCGDCATGLISVTSARRPYGGLARRRFRLKQREEDYAGSAVVALPMDVARRAPGRLLRFVVRSGDFSDPWTYRAAWTIRVARGGP
jgi:hypothetical protein